MIMAENLTDEESRRLSPDSYDATSLLRAVDAVDKLRSEFRDQGDASLRTDLLQLHQLSLRVINQGERGQCVEDLFDLLNGISDQLLEISEAVEQIQEAIDPLAELYPESLDYDSLNDD